MSTKWKKNSLTHTKERNEEKTVEQTRDAMRKEENECTSRVLPTISKKIQASWNAKREKEFGEEEKTATTTTHRSQRARELNFVNRKDDVEKDDDEIE